MSFASKVPVEIEEARIVTGEDAHDYNTFDTPERVTEAAFAGAKAVDGGLQVDLPPASVVEIRVRQGK